MPFGTVSTAVQTSFGSSISPRRLSPGRKAFDCSVPLCKPLSGEGCLRSGRFREWTGMTPRWSTSSKEIRACARRRGPLFGRRASTSRCLACASSPIRNLFRRVFAGVIAAAVAQTESPNSITVRVARTGGKSARIEVINEGSSEAYDDLGDLTPEVEEFRALGGEIGTTGPIGTASYWMTLPLAPGTASAADA